MEFETLKQEQEFDHYASLFLLEKRNPKPEHMALVLVRAHENLNGAPPSISAFERAWRELYDEGSVPLAMEKLIVPVVEKPEVLTAEIYRTIPTSQATRKYRTDLSFKSQVDALIKAGQI